MLGLPRTVLTSAPDLTLLECPMKVSSKALRSQHTRVCSALTQRDLHPPRTGRGGSRGCLHRLCARLCLLRKAKPSFI